MVRYTEHLPHAPLDDRGLPDLAFGFYDRMVVFDNVDKTMYVVVTARVDGPADADRAYREAQQRVDETVAELAATPVTLQGTDIASRAARPRSRAAPISAARILKKRSASASSTSRRATFSRS